MALRAIPLSEYLHHCPRHISLEIRSTDEKPPQVVIFKLVNGKIIEEDWRKLTISEVIELRKKR